MRDVVPPHDRSIRNIPLPAHRRHHVEETVIPPHQPPQAPEEPEYVEDRPRRRRPILFLVAIAVVIGVSLAAGLTYAFGGAVVEVTPKQETFTTEEAVPARLDGPLNILQFETVTQNEVGSRTVSTSGEAKVERRASGTITIKNSYGVAPQRLIKNTRFEAANGKIYRVNDSVDVPGATKRADGSFEPGIADVTIFADSPGEEYNQNPTTFTIPGFKGDPRYEKFTATSKTPLAGGFSGVEKVVSESDLEIAYKSIEADLSTVLRERLQTATPEGYILVKGSERISFEELPRGGDPSGGAVLTKRGVITGAIVKSEMLAASLLKQTETGNSAESVRIEGAVPEVSARSPLSSDFKSELTLTVAGPVTLVWQFDQESLKQMLIGVNLSALGELINQHFKPAIDSATVSLRPFWKSAFPDVADDISIKITGAKK